MIINLNDKIGKFNAERVRKVATCDGGCVQRELLTRYSAPILGQTENIVKIGTAIKTHVCITNKTIPHSLFIPTRPQHTTYNLHSLFSY